MLVACVLLIAALLYGARVLSARGKTGTGQVRVYVNGALYTQAALKAGEKITVTQPDGSINVIEMTDEGFFMAESSCKNQLCVHEGQVTRDNWPTRALGAHIICLPNRVDAELVTLGETEKPFDPNAPDV